MRLSPRLFLLVAVAPAASSTDSSAAPQEPALQVDWFESPINGHWYGAGYSVSSWTQGEALAISLGGHLATVRSQAEQDWLAASLAQYSLAWGLWLGLNDVAVEGDYEWSSGSTSTFRNWASSQPSNSSNQDYVHLVGPSVPGADQWAWNDTLNISGSAPIRPLIEVPSRPQVGWSWPEAASTATRFSQPRAGDLNLDGLEDLVFQEGTDGSGNIGVKLNNGLSFSDQSGLSFYSTGSANVGCIQIADLSGDGWPEIVVANKSSASLGYFLNDGTGGFGSFILIPGVGEVHGLAVADLDSDGDTDMIVGENGQTSNGRAWIVLNEGGGSFSSAQISGYSGYKPYSITAADFDDDGDMDFAIAAWLSDRVDLYQNDGSASFALLQQISVDAPLGITSGRFDGDTFIDLVMTSLAGTVHTFHGQGNGMVDLASTATDIVVNGVLHPIAWAESTDLDRDGIPDLVFGSNQVASESPLAFAAINDGSGAFNYEWFTPESGSGGYYNAMAIALDWDDDSCPELAVTRSDGGARGLFLSTKLAPPDCNANGVPDTEDIATGTSTDCNSNGIPDECDLASGVEADCNGNGIPDTCDLAAGAANDCNANGIPDECEIASGEELDCNANGIPDSCDIAAGLELDCNLNGTPDACDLLAGTSLDCDANGVPDECDITAGAADCNADGIPDVCQIAADPTLDLNANGTLDACEAIGTTYCSPAVANSTGLPGEVTLLGSELIVLNQFFVSARQLPPSSFGFFIASTVPGSINPVPNSQGTLCVIGDVGRGVGGGIFNAGLAGAHIGYANLLSMPQPNGPIAVLAGETWNFQAWYRDAIGGQTTSNFTDAVAVTFQ